MSERVLQILTWLGLSILVCIVLGLFAVLVRLIILFFEVLG